MSLIKIKLLRKPLTEKINHGPKKESAKRKIDIPKDFIKKIKNLGLKVEDAEVLFKSKIDWTAVYFENKIYCVEPGCNYSTKIDNDELTNHMTIVHNYGTYPCDNDHCDYVAASKVNFKKPSEFRFESPISISKLNNYSDFGRESENYFNVKIFSDSRSKSAQKLILKVFSDSQSQIICRLSEF